MHQSLSVITSPTEVTSPVFPHSITRFTSWRRSAVQRRRAPEERLLTCELMDHPFLDLAELDSD